MQSTYLINSPKIEAGVENVHIWYKPKFTDVYAFTGMSFIKDYLLQPMLHFNHPLLQFIDITEPLLDTAALFSLFQNHRIQI